MSINYELFFSFSHLYFLPIRSYVGVFSVCMLYLLCIVLFFCVNYFLCNNLSFCIYSMCNVYYINVKLYVYLIIVHGFPSMFLMINKLEVSSLGIFPLNQFDFKLHYLAYIIFYVYPT